MSNRVLIVEDDRSFASQVKEVVDKHGHTALIAASGPEGVELYGRHEPDIVVVDVMLPGITGIQVVEQIRELPRGRDVPILLMSAMYRNAEFFRDDMERLYIEDFLAKPFSLIDFGRKVDTILESEDAGRAGVRALFAEASQPPAVDTSEPSLPDDKTSNDSPQAEAEKQANQPQSEPGRPPSNKSQPSRAAMPPRPAELRKGQPQSKNPLTALHDGGPFETKSLFPDQYVQLVSTLFHSHSCGVFELIRPGARRSIFFLNGYAVWVDVPDLLDGLPRYLAEESLLTLSQMTRLAETAGDLDGDLRGALCHLKLIPEEELPSIFAAWISNELQRGLSHQGAARFERSEGFNQPLRIEEVNPIQALWQGVYRINNDEWFEAELAELDERSLGKTRSFAKLFGYLGRDPRLRNVAETFREPKTGEQFLNLVNGDRGLGTRALWFMVNSGLISFSDPHPQHAKATAEKTRKRAREAKARAKASRLKGTESTAQDTRTASVETQTPPPQTPPAKPPPTANGPSPAKTSTEPARVAPSEQQGQQPPEEMHVFFEPSAKSARKAEAHDDDRSPSEIIGSDYREKMDLNHYGFLEIGQEATGAEIEAAYNHLAPLYRPRNLDTDSSEELKQMARKLLSRLVAAYEELSDSKRRARYDMSEASRKPAKRSSKPLSAESWEEEEHGIGSAAATVSRQAASGPWYPGQHDPNEITGRLEGLDPEDAESLSAAHREMQQSQFKRAYARLDELRAFDPSNSDILADLCWCQFSMAPDEPRELEKALEWADLALAFDPSHRNALEAKARVLLHAGDAALAQPVLKNLTKVVPNHQWGAAELTKVEAQLEAQSKEDKGGGLRGLLGRGKK